MIFGDTCLPVPEDHNLFVFPPAELTLKGLSAQNRFMLQRQGMSYNTYSINKGNRAGISESCLWQKKGTGKKMEGINNLKYKQLQHIYEMADRTQKLSLQL